MLALIYGTDSDKKKIAREKILAGFAGGKSSLEIRGGSNLQQSEIEQAAGGTSLFGERLAYILEYPSENDIFYDFLLNYLGTFSESQNMFIVMERELLKEYVKLYEKNDAEIILCDVPKAASKKSFNVFSITDAFMSRDKKKTWLLYREAIGLDHAPEAIVGVLFWAVKDMLLKNKFFKWKKEELENISRELVRVMNEAHQGSVEIEEGVEELILKM
jgi:DNA polymerase III delta subunit